MEAKKVAITLNRVSGAEQKETGYSLAAQAKYSKAYCEELGLKIYREFTFQESASKLNDQKKFISILEDRVLPNTINVRGSNSCHISIIPGRIKGTLMVISAIDNLVKGSSGQAIQNMNLILGYPEELGISHISLFP